MTQHLMIDVSGDVVRAADAVAAGAVIAAAFGNSYVLLSRADVAAVQGWVATAPGALAELFDWSALPANLSADRFRAFMDAMGAIGPFGLRGPASALVPAHLTTDGGGMRTVDAVTPGLICPSNALLRAAVEATGAPVLRTGPASRGRRPAPSRADALAAEFPDLMLIGHRDEALARDTYPGFAPTVPTLLAFHRAGPALRPRLTVERPGSLPAADIRQVAGYFGFDVALAPAARSRPALLAA